MRNYDEEECDWGRERGGEKKRGRVRISEIITEATSPRAYCTVQKVASRTHTRTHTHTYRVRLHPFQPILACVGTSMRTALVCDGPSPLPGVMGYEASAWI